MSISKPDRPPSNRPSNRFFDTENSAGPRPESGPSASGASSGTSDATDKSVRELLQRIPFIANYSKSEVFDVLAASTQIIRVAQGETLYRQREETTTLYYIIYGTVHIIRRQQNEAGETAVVMDRLAQPGTLLDRYALIYNLPYTATAEATSDLLVLSFPTSALERLLYRFPDIRPQIIPQDQINRLRTMPLLRRVGLVTLSYLAEELKVERGTPGQILYTDERAAEKAYLINTGQISIYQPRKAQERIYLGTGGVFGFPWGAGDGQRDPFSEYSYRHWAEVHDDSEFFVLEWETLQKLAHVYPHLVDPEIQFTPFKTVSEVSVFAKFPEEVKRKLAGFCSFQHLPQHHLVMQQGDLGDSMWILLKEGKATLSALDSDDKALPRTPVDGVVYFGEIALRAARNVRSTVEAEPGSLWLRLHWRDFRRFVEEEKSKESKTDWSEKLQIHLPEDDAAPGETRASDYDWLGDGEVLVFLRRRHWIALIPKLRWGLFASLGTVPFLALAIYFGVAVSLTFWLSIIVVTLALFWGIADYLNDFFIVTNQRIIQQEKVILTSEQRREALLEQVERIDLQTSLWGNLLGYGTLQIFTAGASGYIEFDSVSEPTSLRGKITRERTLRYMRYRAESKLEIQNALEQRLGLNIVLPSRVCTAYGGEPRLIASRGNWFKRVWRSITVDSQLNLSGSDTVVWRKHWMILIRETITPLFFFVMMMIALVGGLVSGGFGVTNALSTLIAGAEVVIGLSALLASGVLIYRIVDWWNDTYEITNDSIIDVEKLPFFLGEKRKEAPISQIQDVSYNLASPLEMLFNYGDVIIQTAASQGALTFLNVPRPRDVKEEINQRLVEWRREDERRKARERIRDLPDWFELYNRLEAGQETSRIPDEQHESSHQP